MLKNFQFGRLQLRIMRLLWRERLTARQITDCLNKQKGETEVAHSTVQTVLRTLENKRSISHELRERTFIFYALVQEDVAVKKTTKEFLNKLFGGSIRNLMAHFLEHERISSEELQQIEELIKAKAKK